MAKVESMEDYAKALKAMIMSHLNDDYPLEPWSGPDDLDYSVAATVPTPSELFSKEYMDYARWDQGQDFWDILIQAAFACGFSNGALREREHTEFWKQMYEADRAARRG